MRLARGFTLLEVLIAIGILAVFVVSIFQIQSQTINMVQKSNQLTIVNFLARGKLLDCKYLTLKNGFGPTDSHENGNFEAEGHPEIEWECHSYQIQVPLPSEEQIAQGVAMQQGEGGEGGPGLGGLAGSMLAPLFGVLNRLLNESIRELVVIVKWSTGGHKDQIQVVTHLVNREPMLDLLRALPDQQEEEDSKESKQPTAPAQTSKPQEPLPPTPPSGAKP